MIQEGRVSVDGVCATVGMKIREGQRVELDGEKIQGREEKDILIAVNKPRGIVCSEKSQKGETTIIEFLHYPKRITYAGRLDKDSEGLLLMTNRGDWIDLMMRGSHCHEKEYEVTVNRAFDNLFLKQMSAGIYLRELGVLTRPCTIWRKSEKTFGIVLTQGFNRQIRRMCKELGYQVQKLKRVRVLNICLKDLKTGAWRDVTEEEVSELLTLLNGNAKNRDFI